MGTAQVKVGGLTRGWGSSLMALSVASHLSGLAFSIPRSQGSLGPHGPVPEHEGRRGSHRQRQEHALGVVQGHDEKVRGGHGAGTLPQGGSAQEVCVVQSPGVGGSQRPPLPAARSTWTFRTSHQAGAAAWPSAPSSTSSSPTPLTTASWTPPSAGTTSPWPSPPQSKPQPGPQRLGAHA